MLGKKNDTKKGKCPFLKLKPCDEGCILYRSGVRYNENGKNAFPFSDCALNIIADNMEAMHNRTFMMQKEVGETKNVMSLKILSDLGLARQEEVAEKAMKIINPPDVKKLE
jgi:hypothetical protein